MQGSTQYYCNSKGIAFAHSNTIQHLQNLSAISRAHKKKFDRMKSHLLESIIYESR